MEMCVKRDEEAVVLCSKRLGQGITKKINAAAFTHSALSLYPRVNIALLLLLRPLYSQRVGSKVSVDSLSK